MHAFLIIGGSEEDRKQHITTLINACGIKPYDIKPLDITPDALSLGIKTVREWQKQLLLMPHASPYTAGVIKNAHLLTIEAQNALLKSLEEPPAHTRIYMEAQSDSFFLPTILSRCDIIQLSTSKSAIDASSHIYEDLQTLVNPKTTAGQTIATLDEQIKNKEEAKIWITDAINTLHQTRRTWPKQTYVCLMKQLLQAVKQLSSNVSYKLIIDHVFLSAKH
ncbi:MAG: hypothetical protein V1917_03070 [Candidatus Gottesmanbacteria bacterium]